MTEIERYEFDRQGYLVLRDFLTDEEVRRLIPAIDKLEAHAMAHYQLGPRKSGNFGSEYHFNAERGYHVTGGHHYGQTFIIEDFFNFDSAFDFLVNHPRTNSYISSLVQEEIGINNSELRIRYPGNCSNAHGGGYCRSYKYRYSVNAKGIDCMMVRFIYFTHDVSNMDGAFCVETGSHKSAFPVPFECHVDDDPGMIGLEVSSGDAIVFTENLRHGGFTNRTDIPRKTLHVGYGPGWMMSQNIATWDELQYIQPTTWARYDDGQRKLFQPRFRQTPDYQNADRL